MNARENSGHQEEPKDRYLVTCLSCGRTYDAVVSPWCICLTDNPTVLCPHCEHCFCSGNPNARLEFWQAAPPVMWQRRLRSCERAANEPPTDIGNPLRRPLIMVVDDERDTRQIAFHVLMALGYGVLLAKDGIEGLRLAKKYQPDLVLTDQVMPCLTGKHLCRAIKEDPETSAIRVIVMSGLCRRDSQRIEILRDYRADDFLMKPIAYEKLAEVLASWLAAA